MSALYNAVVYFYFFAIKLASFAHPKAKYWIAGRKNWRQKLTIEINPADEWIWVHCSSLGEYEDCAEIIARMRTRHSSSKILLTFFSPSGINAPLSREFADCVTYLPLDTRSNAKDFLNLVKPTFILFSRSDLWYNFLSEIAKREIPTFLLSALVHPTSRFVKWPQKIIYKQCFGAFTQIYCQNEQTKKVLEKHFQNSQCTVTGNSRIDRISNSAMLKEYSGISQFVGDSFCVVAGSCLEKDEKMILLAMKKLNHLKIKWIIVPHEINGKKIHNQIQKNKTAFIEYSKISALSEKHSVLYIDFVGGLKHLYKYGNIAIVGGGFNQIGIHNIIEPTFHGIPTSFGPNHREYPEALELIDLGFATIHHNQAELEATIEKFYTNPPDSKMKTEIKNYVLKNIDASERIVTDINHRMNH